jgi:hypothetical protein
LLEKGIENVRPARALSANLQQRRLNPNRAILVVSDRAKALHKAVMKTSAGADSSVPCAQQAQHHLTRSQGGCAHVHNAMNQA